jgi:antitoxin (DNA-binding transcriptional repressor) of toxin-antitoxin stability system
MSNINSIPIYKAKARLSYLIDRALAGEEIVILRDKVPVVRLTPIDAAPIGRKFGAYKNKASVGPEFFEPLPEEELSAWE